jgi:acylphosphatase
MDAQIARSVVVHGMVQGVGFRWATLDRAVALGIAGWVKNRSDGTVGCHVQGTPVRVREMLDWLATGPRFAEVTRLDVQEVEAGPYSSFDVRY